MLSTLDLRSYHVPQQEPVLFHDMGKGVTQANTRQPHVLTVNYISGQSQAKIIWGGIKLLYAIKVTTS